MPADVRQVYRLVGARTKDEKDAVDSILSEFFEESPDGWRQARCDREIAITNKNRTNGGKGGRPPKNTNPNETQTEPNLEPNGNPNETQHESPRHPSPDHPITRVSHSEKIASESQPTSTSSGRVCARLRKAGIQGVNPSNPKLLALLTAGIPEAEFGDLADEQGARGKSLAWILATVEGRRRDAASAGTVPVVVKEWHETASGIEAKAVELGLEKRFDEGFPAFKARIFEAAGVRRELAA